MKRMPPRYAPTRTVFLDDDRHYPKLVSLGMPSDANITSFHRPDEFIEELKACSDGPVCQDRSHPMSWIDDHAFEEQISVAIVDYQLDDRTGIDVLSELTETPVKKILVSNFMDPKLINDAYRDGLIDAFVSKMDKDFPNSLYDCLQRLKYRFFLEPTKPDTSRINDKLCEPTFCNFLLSLIKKHKITHYCAGDGHSYFALKADECHSPVILYALEENDFENILNSAQSKTASSNLLEKVRNKIAFPCFRDGVLRDGEMWPEHMRPLKLLHGQKNYYVHCHLEI